jgi:hypothetical protein
MDLPAFGMTVVEFAEALGTYAVGTWVGPLVGIALGVDLVWISVKWILKGGKQL